jgi:alpha-mannosidase
MSDRVLAYALWRKTDELEKRRFIHSIKLTEIAVHAGRLPDPVPAVAQKATWKTIPLPHLWGGNDQYLYFRTKFRVPASFAGRPLRVIFSIDHRRDFGAAEALLFVNGKLTQAIDRGHADCLLSSSARANAVYELIIEASAGNKLGHAIFSAPSAVSIDQPTEELYQTARTLFDWLEAADERTTAEILPGLKAAFDLVIFEQPAGAAFYSSVRRALAFLSGKVLPSFARPKAKRRFTLVCGSHLDLAWLWPVEETKRKTARTFSNILALMEQYPDFIFTQPQALLNAWARKLYPELHARIRRRIRQGRWEVTGGWLEPDANMPGGESLVRQFAWGQWFFRREFGKTPRVASLLDTFGYSAALPQIFRQCGIESFITSKMSWNETNRFPYSAFVWEGMDGSRILAHTVTSLTLEHHGQPWRYRADHPMELRFPPWWAVGENMSPACLEHAWEGHRQKAVFPETTMIFGYGDGGGGISREALEVADTAQRMKRFASIRYGRLDDFFSRLAKVSSKLPVLKGELYLEYHRGTLTSGAQAKLNNRAAESCLHDAEAVSVLASLFGRSYPSDPICSAWQTLLLNQFHDTLCGTCVASVYKEAVRDFERAYKSLDGIIKTGLDLLAAKINLSGRPALTVFNTLGVKRSILRELSPRDLSAKATLEGVLTQKLRDGRRLAVFPDVPPYGFKSFYISNAGCARNPGPPHCSASQCDAESHFRDLSTIAIHCSRQTSAIETPFFSLRLNDKAEIVSLRDKRFGREFFAGGRRGNVFQLFEDTENAWEVEALFWNKVCEPLHVKSLKVREAGPLRGVIEWQGILFHSPVRQEIRVYAHTPRIDFVTEIDWREHQRLLKAAFNTGINSAFAAYEIQFGHIRRSTGTRSSRDAAQFEVAAQKWADLSDKNGGLSLLNNCKYGHDIKHGCLRLSLLRAPQYPARDIDLGKHAFTYAILPHGPDWKADTIREAYELNAPDLPVRLTKGAGRSLPPEFSLVRSDNEQIIIETMKQAENGKDLIVRAYESHWRPATATLVFGLPVKGAWETDLLEDPRAAARVKGQNIHCHYRPFEIKTFRVKLKST